MPAAGALVRERRVHGLRGRGSAGPPAQGSRQVWIRAAGRERFEGHSQLERPGELRRGRAAQRPHAAGGGQLALDRTDVQIGVLKDALASYLSERLSQLSGKRDDSSEWGEVRELMDGDMWERVACRVNSALQQARARNRCRQ